MAAKPLRLAAATNVLVDIEDRVEDVLDALDIIKRRLPNADWLVSPSVLDELASLCDAGESERLRRNARSALMQLRSQTRFRPLLDLPFGEDLAQHIAKELRQRGLLPVEEVHDALILAESALLDCSVLLTSDEHLRAIDHEQATFLLHSYDLVAPVIATPREIVRKFFR
jgi:predicted nucleic acid-binding protein